MNDPGLILARHQPIDRRIERDASLIRVRPGVYVDRSAWSALPPWSRYRLRVLAVAETRRAPIFCRESAAILHGLPVFGEPRDIHLLDPDGVSRREGDVVLHGWNDAPTMTSIDGVIATTLDATAVANCRTLPPAFALAVADAALRMLHAAGRTLRVADIGRMEPNRRGRRQLDWVQQRATHLAESPAESVSRAVIEWLGFDDPDLQSEFIERRVRYRADFFWSQRNVIGEVDGYGKYRGNDIATTHALVVREKRREDALRRRTNGFARWEWGDAVHPARLDRILRAAGLCPHRPPQPGFLATLPR